MASDIVRDVQNQPLRSQPLPSQTALTAAAARAAHLGFDPARPALVSWLGVTMYLTQPALSQILEEISKFAPGTELITDYMLRPACARRTARATRTRSRRSPRHAASRG